MPGKVDVLTLSPISMPDEGIGNFVKLALEHNPDVRVTVQEFWLPNDEYVPVYPLQTFKQIDHNATDLSKLREAQAKYDHDVEAFVHNINTQLGKPVISIVPVGQAMLALREKIVAGQAHGITAQAQLFTDCWGHPSALTEVLASYCHYAVIYRRSPVGLPMPTLLSSANNPQWDDETNRLLQKLAWDAVTHNPYSGVKADK